MAEFSPMMQQYFEIKKQHKDAILFYRIGDFYEMFYDDALTVSKELELTLTGKQCGQEERAPMCGVPFHSYEGYVARLIAKGYKVAICEQMEDPATAKGLVKRDIIRIVTPGTVIEQSMLQDDRNNYIASIYLKGNKAGLCFADISTGMARATELNAAKIAPAVISELSRFHPSEVLINTEVLKCRAITDYIKQSMTCSVELMEDGQYAPGVIDTYLSEQFGRNWSSSGVMPASPLIRNAFGVLLQYLHETQKHGVERLKTIETYSETQYMHLSSITRANLELTETMRGREKKGTLLWVLDKTNTAMGKRLLRTWIEQPLVDAEAINRRLNAVQALYQNTEMRLDLTEQLSRVFDIERLMTRTVYGSATPKEIYALAQTCDKLPEIKRVTKECSCAELQALSDRIDILADIRDLIYAAIKEDAPSILKEGGVIREGYHPEIDELREIMAGGKGILGEMEAKLRLETKIPKLKIGFNRVFGYYIEVSNSFKNLVPDTFIRKQTLTGGERYITQELKDLENRILGASEREIALEHKLFSELLKTISSHLTRIQETASAVSELDVYAAFAQNAVDNNYVRPVVDAGKELHIVEGRHPVVEQMLHGALFVPNDTLLDCAENRTLIITGPNMAGKSTYMRQNALIVLLAQIGSFVPARECHVGVVDAIFTRVGASDDLAAGQSTFMVEMTEVAQILQNATGNSLVILDEIGRGTSTFDGMSIARAVVEHINDPEKGLGCKTLFATHYHELTDLEEKIPGVKNYNIAVKKRGEDITFLRRIVRGAADDSYGIEVAKLAGLPGTVTRRAHEILRVLEANAPGKSNVEQLGFEALQEYAMPQLPGEVVERLEQLDVETLTPIEALNFLYELKKALKGTIHS